MQPWCSNCPRLHPEQCRRSQKACAQVPALSLAHWATFLSLDLKSSQGKHSPLSPGSCRIGGNQRRAGKGCIPGQGCDLSHSYLEARVCPDRGAAAAQQLLGRLGNSSHLLLPFHLQPLGRPCAPAQSLVTPAERMLAPLRWVRHQSTVTL